jgi:hypothetical protein
LPSQLVALDEVGFQYCLIVEWCPLCGLGFAVVWIGKLAPCKHFYHCWCVIVHFNTLEKCIKLGREEYMHGGLWSSARIKKIEVSYLISNFKPISRAKNFPPTHKFGCVCNFSCKRYFFKLYVHLLIVLFCMKFKDV